MFAASFFLFSKTKKGSSFTGLNLLLSGANPFSFEIHQLMEGERERERERERKRGGSPDGEIHYLFIFICS